MHFDGDNEIMYVQNKGQAIVQFYYCQNASSNPKMDLLMNFKARTNTVYNYFMPKKHLDFMSNEIARTIRVGVDTVEYISFKVPRKTTEF